MNTLPLKLVSAFALCAIALPTPAMALTKWQRTHPARAEVNARIATQQHRITQEVKAGEITHQQAQELRANDHAIRQQERAYAQANGNHGHLTRAQVRALNSQLNANSQAIGH